MQETSVQVYSSKSSLRRTSLFILLTNAENADIITTT